MLDFQAVRDEKISMDALVAGLTKNDLLDLTHEMLDTILALIVDTVDADVIFVPEDPEADDPFADDEANVDLAWTLGHVIVHCNASLEESAALAAELARGVKFHGRSRWEVPWEAVKTVAECRTYLEQCRRMCLASLEMWPDEPHLDNFYQYRKDSPKITPLLRYIYGLSHADSHQGQIAEIVRQAKAARD